METTKRKYKKHKKGYKIGVNYFLDTHKKPDVHPYSGEEFYPLYITVRVKGKSTTVKSRLNLKSTINAIDSYLHSDLYKPYIENEKKIIEETIKSLEPDKNDNFDLQKWHSYYESGLISVHDSINNMAKIETINLLKSKYKANELEISTLRGGGIPTLKLLVKLGVSDCAEILEKYEPLFEIRQLNIDINNKDKTAYQFCIWDIISGFYQEQVINKVGEYNTTLINDLVNIIKLYVALMKQEAVNKKELQDIQKPFSNVVKIGKIVYQSDTKLNNKLL